MIRIAVLMYVRFPLSLRNVEDLLAQHGIDITHETVRYCWNRFGPMFAADIRRQRVSRMKGFRHWRWHVDEVFVKINGKTHYLWRAVDHEGEILESYITKKRDKKAALRFLKKALKRHGPAEKIVTDGLKSYPVAMRELGNLDRREMGRWQNNRVENSHLAFRRKERVMLTCPTVKVRRGHEIRLITPPANDSSIPANRDEKLVALVAEARAAANLIFANPETLMAKLAKEHSRCRTRLAKLAVLSCLAPDIIIAIVEGRQPASLDARTLLASELPLDWQGQRATLGFSQV